MALRLMAYMTLSIILMSFIDQVNATTAGQHNPVVFIHGMYSMATVFTLHMNYLATHGWDINAMTAVELLDKVSFGPVNAETISNAVDMLLQKTGASKVDIVAHSMGGANTMYYILHGGASKVDKVVTLGGANRLVTSFAPSGVKVTTISSSTDTIVNPLLSELSGANNILISGVSHIGLLSDSNVQKLVAENLS